LPEFEEVWAAAGMAHHVFGLSPQEILHLSGVQGVEFTSFSK